MSNYYYTVASLPMLFYDGDLPMTPEAFLKTCESNLTEDDCSTVRRASLDPLRPAQHTCPSLDRWDRWETGLRNELVRLRASKRGIDPESMLRKGGADTPELAQIARDAHGQASPLEAEDALNRARWSFLDGLETGHYFDIEKLVIYYLKFQILQRKSRFDIEQGTEKFKTLVPELST